MTGAMSKGFQVHTTKIGRFIDRRVEFILGGPYAIPVSTRRAVCFQHVCRCAISHARALCRRRISARRCGSGFPGNLETCPRKVCSQRQKITQCCPSKGRFRTTSTSARARRCPLRKNVPGLSSYTLASRSGTWIASISSRSRVIRPSTGIYHSGTEGRNMHIGCRCLPLPALARLGCRRLSSMRSGTSWGRCCSLAHSRLVFLGGTSVSSSNNDSGRA